MSTNRSHTRQWFPEGVDVRIPPQPKAVKAISEDILDLPLAPGQFTPFRHVIHLKTVEVADPKKEVRIYDPPIEIRVSYSAQDVADAKGEDNLILGFWDGKQWIRFSNKHQFKLVPNTPPNPGGWGIVTLKAWVDPVVSWGR